MPTTDAQGRTISDDGYYWWDGSAWQLIQRPAGRSFLDSVADSVEGAVKKVEGTQGGAPIVAIGSSQPAPAAAPAPTADGAPTAAPEAVPAAQPQAGFQPQPAAAADPQPAAGAQPQPAPAVPAIPEADLHAYLGALKVTGMVTEAEFADITQRIRARG
jgi:hypothetical protein